MTWRGGAKKGGARVVRAKKAESTGAEGRERQKDKRTAVKGGGGEERAAKGRRRGMYGDSESCDSTIKLGEFCSWRGVVPLTLAPSFATGARRRSAPLAPFPFRRSAVIYGLIRLIFPATPNSIVLSLVFLASARTPKTTSPHHPHFAP